MFIAYIKYCTAWKQIIIYTDLDNTIYNYYATVDREEKKYNINIKGHSHEILKKMISLNHRLGPN
jgi:hypothetical protein